jgi:hypothetical protein
MAAAALALGAAGPAQACAPGYSPSTINHTDVCVPNSTGGVPGGGTGTVGGGGSTVPGQAPPVVGGGGGAPGQPVPYAPAPAPYVPPAPVQAPAPVYAQAPVPVQSKAPDGYTPAAPNQPVKGVTGSGAENPVIDGVPAEAPAPDAAPADARAAVTPEATSVVPSKTPSATPSATAKPSAAAIQSEPAAQTDNGTAPALIVGSLGALVLAAAAVLYRRMVRGSRAPARDRAGLETQIWPAVVAVQRWHRKGRATTDTEGTAA